MGEWQRESHGRSPVRSAGHLCLSKAAQNLPTCGYSGCVGQLEERRPPTTHPPSRLRLGGGQRRLLDLFRSTVAHLSVQLTDGLSIGSTRTDHIDDGLLGRGVSKVGQTCPLTHLNWSGTDPHLSTLHPDFEWLMWFAITMSQIVQFCWNLVGWCKLSVSVSVCP